MLWLYISISIILALGYTGFILFLLKRWPEDVAVPNNRSNNSDSSLTILIPARNEEKNIRTCLGSLLNNEDITSQVNEILVIDDHSSDTTVIRIKEMNHPLIKVFELADLKSDSSLGSKKEAIDFGVSLATGEYILQLDADCIVGPKYISTLIAILNKYEINFLAGPVRFGPSQNMLEHFQTMDLSGMMALTKAGIDNKKWYLANGANMAYRKDLAEALDKRFASGDDVARINQLAHLDTSKIHFSNHKNLIVTSPPLPDLISLIKQRLRWGTKNKHTKSLNLLGTMGLVFVQSLWFYVHAIAIVCFGIPAITIGTIHLFLKLSLDYLLLDTSTKYYDSEESMKWFLPGFVLQQFYISIIGIASLIVKRYEWKGRVVK